MYEQLQSMSVIRFACTVCHTSCRGGTGNKLDQSLFQQICGCLEGQDDIKLYLFTEKEELNLK